MFQKDSRAAEKVRVKLTADALQRFQQSQNDRWRQERQWYLNMAFYFGQHHVKFRTINRGTSNQADLYVPPAPYYRVRLVLNHIRKIMRKDISRLTAQKPNAYVVPASIEDRDIFAAQAAEQIWDSLWRKLSFNRTLRFAVFWQVVCGNGFLKHNWDHTLIDREGDPKLGQADEQGNVYPPLFGDVSIKAETPFHVYVPDLKEETLEGQPYMIHAQIRDEGWLKRNLGVVPDESRMSSVEESMLEVMGLNQQHKRSGHIVLEVWAKPGAFDELPEGGMFTIAANRVIQGFDVWPYSHGEYPFSKLDAIPTGKFYNDSIAVDLIPLNRELNRTRSQIIEAKNKMAKPQLLAEEGAVNPAMITTEPGLVITYKPGFDPPTPLPMQNLPNYVTEEVARLYTDMADLSGQHEVSQGQVPPGVTAATAISYLQEQDESLLSPLFDSVEEAVAKTGRQTLSYVHEFWDEPRLVKIVGNDGAFDVKAFKGSDLRSNTDLRVEGGSALPMSKAAKQAFITDLMKMGFIPPEEGLEVLEIGGLNKIYERVQVDKRQAQRENLKMSVATKEQMQQHMQLWEQDNNKLIKQASDNGLKLDPPLIVSVNTWDNHQIHIMEHNKFRKSQAFEMLSQEVKVLFEEHVKQHMESMAGMLPSPINQGIVPDGSSDVPSESSQDGLQQPNEMGPIPQVGQGQSETLGGTTGGDDHV